jgi:N-acetyl-gamma-glutamyl-phosphate reductase
MSAPDVFLVDPDEVDPSQVNLVFVCLPHGHAAACVEKCRNSGVRVVDLSGDLRLCDAKAHATSYGTPRNEALLDEAVYGLTETARAKIPDAQLVSNPGCYATCVGLALWPLAERGLLSGSVVVNALSGVSGGGRQPSHETHFCAAIDDVRPYNLGRRHRHVAEIQQYLSWWTGSEGLAPALVFNPHVIPIERGMLATIVTRVSGVDDAELRSIYEERYAAEPFVALMSACEPARVRAVTRTNQAVIGVERVAHSDHVVITCAIDNLLKGASGQAIQNMNLMFGFPEAEGFVVTSGAALERSAPVQEVYACQL